MKLSTTFCCPIQPSLETVILLHGLWMNGLCLYPLARCLRAKSYQTICFSYHSLRDSPGNIIHQLYQCIMHLETEIIHFVGHSLGGLLIQHLFETYPEQRPGRVVTLGTPFAGSIVAQRFYSHPRGRRLLGMSAEEGLLIECVPPWRHVQALGVIAGTRPRGIGRFITYMPSPSDGTVSVAETKLAGMADHCLINTSHTGLPFSAEAARQVDAFLKYGHFKRNCL